MRLELHETVEFSKWIRRLRDIRAVARIEVRLVRLSMGLAGDVRPVGAGVSELRIDYGPGYRVYFKRAGSTALVLLTGGQKAGQQRDIERAIELARDLEEL